MKTTLDLPDDLMTEIKILAARTNRKMKDIITESLRRDLAICASAEKPSLRDIEPVNLGTVKEVSDEGGSEDILEEMLDERGHRY